MMRASTSRWVVVCALAFCTQACAAAFVPPPIRELGGGSSDGSRLGVGLLHRDPDGHVVAVSSRNDDIDPEGRSIEAVISAYAGAR